MKLTHTIVVMFCILTLFAACNKSDDASPTEKKLMAGVWQITASTYTVKYNGKDTTVNSYAKWRPCEQDDLLIFQLHGEGRMNENADRCPEDEQTGEFTWELLDNDRRLKITLQEGYMLEINDATTATYDIAELTDTRLVMRSLDSTATVPASTETFRNIR